jgi:hypothetical protein
VVLTVSIGINRILNAAAENEANRVFTPTGIEAVEEDESKRARAPAFAAVSPKRERGPWRRAGT